MEDRKANQYHDGFEDGLEPLQPLDIGAVESVDALVRAMSRTSFGGRRTGEAADTLEAMVRDPDCGVVLTLSGAMTIAKMGLVITEMIDRGMVQVIVSTGALVAHGLVEGAGHTHFKTDPRRTDLENYRDGYNRIYDTVELERNLDDCEAILRTVLDQVGPETVLCSSHIHELIGAWLIQNREGRGILQSAYQKGVPVFAPAFTDSELGLDIALYNRELAKAGKPTHRFDPYLDLEYYTAHCCSRNKLGIFTIGGGVPRNWAQEIGPYVELCAQRETISQPQSRRFTYALRICPEPVHWGGLSGCTYQEGVSWGKFVPPSEGGCHTEVPADATIAWPLVVRAVIERLERDPAPPKNPTPAVQRGVPWTG